MKSIINKAYLENIAKAAYEHRSIKDWDNASDVDKELAMERAEITIMAFLHPIMPTMQNAVNAIVGAYPGSQQVLMMLDEILQMRVGLGLQSQIEAPPERPKLTLVPKEDPSAFEEINKANHEAYINHKKQELLQDPIVHEAYVLQAQHNEEVDEHNKAVIERDGRPYELRFKVNIEFHDDLRWLVGTSVTDGGQWASTPDELLKAVKDNIEYLETHKDEIKQLLGGQ